MSIPMEGFELAGLALSGKTRNADGQAMIDCGHLWGRFMQEDYASRITNKSSEELYAVYFDYEGDHTQPYAFFIGCQIPKGAPTPEGMDRLVIPSQQYQQIVAKGKFPECIGVAWGEIWNSDWPRAYTYDFEVYGAKSQMGDMSEVAIYIAIK